MNGWKPFKAFSMVNWCGHGQEYQPWPQADGYWLLVPVLGRNSVERGVNEGASVPNSSAHS
jgi:hypothetical protein